MVLQLAFVSGSSLELESNTMTENRELDFRGKVEERERDVDREMFEVSRAAWKKALEYHEAHKWKSSAMASGRERDVVGEMKAEDKVMNQIGDYLKTAWMLIKYLEAPIRKSSAMASGSSQKFRTQIQAPVSDAKDLQLRFQSTLRDSFYTGNKAEDKLGFAITVKLIDKSTGHVVTSGPVSRARLVVVAVEGNFDNEDDDDWTLEDFQSRVVTDRDGKKLLDGNLELSLNEGVGSLEEFTFTDNTGWMPKKKIRLGLKVAPGSCEGIRVREAKSNPFVVKDRRGEPSKKHHPPASDDEVWRLEIISKTGRFCDRLHKAGIFKVREFLWKLKLSKVPQELRKILGTTISNRKWETLVEHAKTCDLSGQYYVYYADHTTTKNSGVVFENVFELCGLIEDGVYYSAENLSDSQKVSADSRIREACDNACDSWKHIEKYDMIPSKRARSSPTDVVTGDHESFDAGQQVPTPFRTPVASHVPAVGGDGPATSSDPSEQANGNTALPVMDPIYVPILEDDIVNLQSPHRYPSKQAGGIINMSGDEHLLATLPDHSKQADGTNELSLQGFEAFTTDDDPLRDLSFPDHSEQADGTIELCDEACEKHYPPASDDEVWRLDNICKNGHFRDRLNKAGIFKVREFLWKLGRDSPGLWEILGTSMTIANWEILVEHAKTCDLSGKYYVCYAETKKNSGVVFENVFELCGLTEDGVYYSAENLSDSQKVSADTWIREACDNACDSWKHIEEYHMIPSKRARSSPTDVVTGGHESFDAGQQVPTPFSTPVASYVPAVGDPPVPFDQQVPVPGQPPSYPYFNRGQDFKGDGPATSSDPSQQAYESTDRAYEVPANPRDYSEQADGTRYLSLENLERFIDFTTDDEPLLQPAPDHSKLADGTNEFSVEDYEGLMPIDMNPSEGERFQPTDIETWASENFGIEQQDSTLFGTPVTSRDQAFVNQWMDGGGGPRNYPNLSASVPRHQEEILIKEVTSRNLAQEIFGRVEEFPNKRRRL